MEKQNTAWFLRGNWAPTQQEHTTTELKIEGDDAVRWMSFAQCFAGPPKNPPQPNTRYKIGLK